MTCSGGDIPIFGIFTRGLSGRNFGRKLEHFPDFYCPKVFISIPALNVRILISKKDLEGQQSHNVQEVCM